MSDPVSPKERASAQATKSLARTGNSLALPVVQQDVLNRADLIPAGTFRSALDQHSVQELRARSVEILQINVGKVCNQTCTHCHVDAGPDRRESMELDVAQQIAEVLKQPEITTLDITGGAPEMNPHFRWLVEQASSLGKRVIDRCNLTILRTKGYEDLSEFLAHHNVEVVASLPCYLEENCDAQRGSGVFRKSIEALKELNGLGYGQDRTLTLVYNPVGAKLPPDQKQLEDAYREQLRKRYGVEFSNLIAITNMPISRFLHDLLEQGQYQDYMQTLIDAFNPATLDSLMCRNTLSVDWKGYLFDCDFNQMLDMPANASPTHISDWNWEAIQQRRIEIGNHCFGCTAGSGSSCQGSIA